jgi:hypothetical protein
MTDNTGQWDVEMPEGLKQLMAPLTQTATAPVPPTLTYVEAHEEAQPEWLSMDAFAPMEAVGIGRLFDVLAAEDEAPPPSNYELPEEFMYINPRWVMMCQLRASGAQIKDIAQALNMTPAAIITRLKDPRVHKLLAYFLSRLVEKTDIVNDLIRQSALAAAMQLVRTLHSPGANDDVKMRAATRILDMAGHKPVERREVEVSGPILKPGDLERMRQADGLLAAIEGLGGEGGAGLGLTDA